MAGQQSRAGVLAQRELPTRPERDGWSAVPRRSSGAARTSNARGARWLVSSPAQEFWRSENFQRARSEMAGQQSRAEVLAQRELPTRAERDGWSAVPRRSSGAARTSTRPERDGWSAVPRRSSGAARTSTRPERDGWSAVPRRSSGAARTSNAPGARWLVSSPAQEFSRSENFNAPAGRARAARTSTRPQGAHTDRQHVALCAVQHRVRLRTR